ncbi:NUMOD4 domain-containing protein [Lentilactobacillus buchneri]|uniref:NUMOD4 domain-containing protein n=1 Tax=Lentilactobacillus buchneri TaxID=1581 RepID=UPI001290F14D|nr:NUMOD4 domain-containing protein [Lentilactobacillus buchneri]MQN23664.1 HNH endonuclease [Lentilactobacillus buchneri]
MTEWKDIPNYEHIYQASTDGQIRTAPGKVTHNALCAERHWKVRILKPKTDRDGYKRVCLWKNAKENDWLVHRLIAETFIPKVSEKNLINHIDGNPSNNHVSNLEWCTYSENLIHAYTHHLNQENNEIVLVNKKTMEAKYFYSLTQASKYLGKNHGFLSVQLKRHIREVGDYLVFIPA